MATLTGPGASLVPKQEIFSDRFWYVHDESSPAHLFLIYNDRTKAYVPRPEEHSLAYVDQTFVSPTAMLGYGYLKLINGEIGLVNSNPAPLVDFIVRENLRLSFEHRFRLRLNSRGATAQDVYSALIRHRCSSVEARSSSKRWRRLVWEAHTSLSWDDKYDLPLTTEPLE